MLVDDHVHQRDGGCELGVNALVFSVGGVLYMNINTYKKIYKKIYSDKDLFVVFCTSVPTGNVYSSNARVYIPVAPAACMNCTLLPVPREYVCST